MVRRDDEGRLLIRCAECGGEYPIAEETAEDHDESCAMRDVLKRRGITEED